MKAYKLLKDVPGLRAGVVFVHDEHDAINGSPACGCLKLAWDDGSCQDGWCAETHIFPGQLINDKNWFVKIKNERVARNEKMVKRYTI